MDLQSPYSGSIRPESAMDSSSPSGGDMLTSSRPMKALNCPRCDSTNTRFCYYNNYNLSQPRYFCKTCRRYWTEGGTLRNTPVGGGCGKNKKIVVTDVQSPHLRGIIGSGSSRNFDFRENSRHDHVRMAFGLRNHTCEDNLPDSTNIQCLPELALPLSDHSSAMCQLHIDDELRMFAFKIPVQSFKQKKRSLYRISQETWRNANIGKRIKTLLMKKREETILPISRNLENTSPEEKSSNWKAFLFSAGGSRMIKISPKAHGAILFVCVSRLLSQAENSTNSSTKTSSQSLLNLGEALTMMFFPEMAHIAVFMVWLFLAFVMILPLPLQVQIAFILVMVTAPLLYFPERLERAWGIDVACGSFKLPLSFVTILGAFGLFVVCVLVTSFIGYFVWRFIHKGRPEVETPEVNWDDLYDALDV